jgi:6-phospho-beta-glucosidase
MTRITVLGGSSVGTPELIAAMLRRAAGRQPPQTEIVLHGRTRDKLIPVARVAERIAQGSNWLQVSATTDLAEALTGAEVVLNQVRVGGLQARAFDETFPQQFGIPGEETVGPGGFANALRTVPVVVEFAQQIERHTPDALLLSFTNPASVVQYAVTKTSKLRVIGLCDAAIGMTAQAAQALGCTPGELTIDYVGMHHFSFITRARRDGEDVTAQMLAGLDRVSNFDMDVDVVRSMGVLPTPYFKYFLHPDRVLEKQRAQKHSRAEQLLAVEKELLDAYASAESPEQLVSKRGAKWYDALIAPVLLNLIEGRRDRFVLNIVNGATLPWMPRDAIIEMPCWFENGIATPDVADAPDVNKELRARIQLNCAYEQLMVEAILEHSYDKALRALAMNPMVGTVDQARRVLSVIWSNSN